MENNAHSTQTLSDYVAESWQDLREACTRCGKCVEVCPVVPFADAAREDPKAVVAGVFDFVGEPDAAISKASYAWAKQCNGCGDCIPACPEGVNPRRMLALANAEIARRTNPTPHLFHKLSRAIRIMVSMQAVPGDVARLLRPKKPRPVDVVFYTGCNAIRTPHVLFNAMCVLDTLGVNYEVMGGPASCCGIVHSKWEGDLPKGGRVSEQTLQKFGNFEPERVLNWCPSCQIHFTQTIEGYREVKFDIDHITRFLIERKDQLRALFTTPVNMRVMLHTHRGLPEVSRDVKALLQCIPGLTIVDEVEEQGYMCGNSGSDRCLGLKQQERTRTVDHYRRDDMDAVVSLYHACHRSLASDGKAHGFKVVSFTDLLVRALGHEPYEDLLDQFRGRDDWRAIVEEAAPMLEANGIEMDPDELAAVLPDIFSMAEYRGGLAAFAPEE
jgi:heterodisulfide reductase subunit D